jgi:hypothetical protein
MVVGVIGKAVALGNSTPGNGIVPLHIIAYTEERSAGLVLR